MKYLLFLLVLMFGCNRRPCFRDRDREVVEIALRRYRELAQVEVRLLEQLHEAKEHQPTSLIVPRGIK